MNHVIMMCLRVQPNTMDAMMDGPGAKMLPDDKRIVWQANTIVANERWLKAAVSLLYSIV